MFILTFIYCALIGNVLLEPTTGTKDHMRDPEHEINTSIVWHWEDSFSPGEKRNVKNWLMKVTSAVEATLGVYPFDLHFYINRRNGSSEPVPWANTRRDNNQGVKFYINPSFAPGSFTEDWTAPHEISHLSIPYLGKQNAWFAEGYASFMQYQIMEKLNVYSRAQVQEKYEEKIEMAKPHYQRSQDFITTARSLQSRHRYPEMYWGSASYFIRLDKNLREEHGTSLPELIKKYQECCRLEDRSVEEVVTSWDKILGEPIFSKLLHTYQSAPASRIL